MLAHFDGDLMITPGQDMRKRRSFPAIVCHAIARVLTRSLSKLPAVVKNMSNRACLMDRKRYDHRRETNTCQPRHSVSSAHTDDAAISSRGRGYGCCTQVCENANRTGFPPPSTTPGREKKKQSMGHLSYNSDDKRKACGVLGICGLSVYFHALSSRYEHCGDVDCWILLVHENTAVITTLPWCCM